MSVPAAYFAVVLIWSTTPLGIVWSSESVNPTMAVLLRMVIAAVLGLSVILITRIKLPWHRKALQVYSYSAIGIFFGMLFSYLAAGYISSGMISLIFGLAPIFSGLLSQKILDEAKLTRLRKIAMTIALIGLGIVCAGNMASINQSPLGIIYILIAVFFFSLSGVLVKSVKLVINPMATTVGSLLVSLPFFFLVWLLFDGTLPIEQWQSRSILAIIYLGVVGSFIGFVAYFYVLQRLKASTVALITMITPVIAMSLGVFLNNETVTLNLIIGAICVLTGLGLYQASARFIGDKSVKFTQE